MNNKKNTLNLPIDKKPLNGVKICKYIVVNKLETMGEFSFDLLPKDDVVDFVEFNITGDASDYNRCDNDSLYLRSSVFNIFGSCFERSNHLFDFVVPCKYNARQFIPLLNELSAILNELLAINNVEQFRKYFNRGFVGEEFINTISAIDANYERNWRSYMRKLIRVNRHIMRLVDQCIDEERTLWVIPY